MEIPGRVIEALNAYHDAYRHPRLPRLEVSKLYSLFPDAGNAGDSIFKWPSDWPNGGKPGVYFIFDAVMDLRYVGKAVILGRRLSNYFGYSNGKGSECFIRHPGWKSRPAFVATVPMNRSFEISSLEEYLISVLAPKDNTLGMPRAVNC